MAFAQKPDLPLDEAVILGNTRLLQDKLALILNSRQSKTPVGNDPWLKGTLTATKRIVEQGRTLLSSIGMNTWELSLWAVGECGGNAVIICPSSSDSPPEENVKSIADNFQLDPDRHAWIFIRPAGQSRSGKAWWEARDWLAFGLADHLYPVSIRKKGRWVKWLAEGRSNQAIDERFISGHEEKRSRRSKLVVPETCFSCGHWPYLTHWTCRCHGPWPGERASDFYREIAASACEYPRSAKRSLARILEEDKLRGSGKRIRGGRPVVSFTELAPSDALPLMRWRKRYVRPTFEPYGIAIHKRAADKLGIRKVAYVLNGGKASTNEPEFTQGYGTGDWPAEAEWRASGDVDLSSIPPDDLLVLVPSLPDAEWFRRMSQFRVQALSESFLPV